MQRKPQNVNGLFRIVCLNWAVEVLRVQNESTVQSDIETAIVTNWTVTPGKGLKAMNWHHIQGDYKYSSKSTNARNIEIDFNSYTVK